MAEDIKLRFALAKELNERRSGRARAISGDLAHRAWPPTGDCDRSIEGTIRALALAAGGNRPEESYTTEERIRRDLDDTFDVKMRPMSGDWVITRKLSACPHCRGTGFKRQYLMPDIGPLVGDGAFDATTEIVTHKIVDCAHEPDRS